ncbi:unnamed protein product [Owenia fusiformis]|uniref:NAD(P)(+)--arginine ADP-ribosyltransferase n=1 Tax=Owenia fusiformis TaxID=6347 RepID=A0A8S4PJI6_OWEFU|nr:unnamed protein product [Owenia fusiformis]
MLTQRIVGVCALLAVYNCKVNETTESERDERITIDKPVIDPLNGNALDMINVTDRRATERAIKELLEDRKETSANPAIDTALKYVDDYEATNSKAIVYPYCLDKSEGRAISAYTAPLPECQKQFNAATRSRILALESSNVTDIKNNPMEGWKEFFKQIKQGTGKLKTKTCIDVYRGVEGSHSQLKNGDLINFRQFASTSKNENHAYLSAKPTLYEINTCFGADIERLSVEPNEKEVLIPPTEFFEIISLTTRTIHDMNGRDKRISVYKMRSKGAAALLSKTNSSVDDLCNVPTPRPTPSSSVHVLVNIELSTFIIFVILFSLLK